MTELALRRLGLAFDPVLTREDTTPKPDPAGLLQICRTWNVNVAEVLFVGDFHFDIIAGRRAGITTVLYAPGGPPDYAHEADFVVAHLSEIGGVLTNWPAPRASAPAASSAKNPGQ
jgi:phosphoglycolate phosphatase-like HAD superfamily hydrolase